MLRIEHGEALRRATSTAGARARPHSMPWRLPRLSPSLLCLFLLLAIVFAGLTEKEKRATEQTVRQKTKAQLEEILEHLKIKPPPGASKEEMQQLAIKSGYMIY